MCKKDLRRYAKIKKFALKEVKSMKVKTNHYVFKKQMFLNGYNFSDLSKETGVGVPYLSRVINNKHTPSPKLAKSISQALGVEIQDLFEVEMEEV